MQKYHLDNDISVLCVTADVFPEGITNAFDRLKKKLSGNEQRTLFGLSYPDHGKIIYKAAAQELYPGEAEKLGCERMTILKGDYVSEDLENWEQRIPAIGEIFQRLIHSRPDLTAPCIEWYQGQHLRCMVRINGH